MKENQNCLELESYIPCQLATLSNTVIRSVASVFEEWFDISIPEWKVMGVVRKMPGMSAVDVANCAGLDTVAVSRAVTKLMDTGRIHREFGREDRRRSVLQLTPAGKDLYEEVLPLAKSLESSLLASLTDEEAIVFEKALDSLLANSKEFAAQFEMSAPPRLKPADRTNKRSYSTKESYSAKEHSSHLANSLIARFTLGVPTLR